MKIRFIVPRWPRDSFWDVITFKFPSLNTTLLAALTPLEHQVSIHDESIAPLDFEEECDLVAITAMTPLAPRGYEIAEEYRRRGVLVVMGGMHPTWLPEEAIAHCDAVVIGEADEVCSSFLQNPFSGIGSLYPSSCDDWRIAHRFLDNASVVSHISFVPFHLNPFWQEEGIIGSRHHRKIGHSSFLQLRRQDVSFFRVKPVWKSLVSLKAISYRVIPPHFLYDCIYDPQGETHTILNRATIGVYPFVRSCR